jgi:hypothetical protein
MAKTDPLKKSQRQAVADQLGRMMARGMAAPAGARMAAAAEEPELGESLAVCTLTAQQVLHPPADFAEIARPSGTWHHQVHTAGGVTHAARSQVGGIRGDDQHVTQMFQSPIAEKIDAAITWLDRKLARSSATVRLLIAPAYYLHALLIVRGRDYSVVVADQPATFTQLEPKTIYPMAEFLAKLGRERPSGNLGEALTGPPAGAAAAAPLTAAMSNVLAAAMPEPRSQAELDVLLRRVTPNVRDLEREVSDALTGSNRSQTLARVRSRSLTNAIQALHAAGGPEMVRSAIEGSGDFGGIGWRVYKALHGVEWDQQGEFHGPSTITWRAARDYLFRPDPANPFFFVRSNGQRIQPATMMTDGGSIPRLVWSVPDMDPWAYLPAYLLHDWLFTAHHCVPDQAGSFEDANTILAEAIYTMMVTGMVGADWRKVEVIYQAVSSFVGRRVWDRVWTTGECDATLRPPA